MIVNANVMYVETVGLEEDRLHMLAVAAWHNETYKRRMPRMSSTNVFIFLQDLL